VPRQAYQRDDERDMVFAGFGLSRSAQGRCGACAGDLAKLNVEVKVITGPLRDGHAAIVGLDPTSMLTGDAGEADDEAPPRAQDVTLAEIDPGRRHRARSTTAGGYPGTASTRPRRCTRPMSASRSTRQWTPREAPISSC
jgi:hypothetical protein